MKLSTRSIFSSSMMFTVTCFTESPELKVNVSCVAVKSEPAFAEEFSVVTLEGKENED